MAHEPWLVFGLDGRTPADINSAVELGYRRFDTAESYRTPDNTDTTAALSEAVKNLRRGEYEVLSKIDVDARESVAETKDRVTRIANQFGGELDAVLIHNLEGVPEPAVKQTWNALHELKREGVIKKAGVSNIMPHHDKLVYELASRNKFDVVDFSPPTSPANSQQGSDKGSPKTKPKSEAASEATSDKQLGHESDSDESSKIFGVVENSVRGVLADPKVQEMLTNLGEKTDLYYYNVLRTLNEVKSHHGRRNSGVEPNVDAVSGAAGIAEMAAYRVPGDAHMILSSGNRQTQETNLAAFRHDTFDYANRPFVNAGQMEAAQKAVHNWSSNQDACQRYDREPLPKNVTDKLKPLFENADTQRAEAHKWIAGQNMPVNREGVSQWLMKERGFEREQLEILTVPDRVGLRSAYRDMRLADVMAAQFGAQNCNYKWADQLAAPLLQSAQQWHDAGLKSVLTEIATPVSSAPSSTGTRRSPSPDDFQLSASGMAALSLAGGPGRANPPSSPSGDHGNQPAGTAQKPAAQGPRR